MSPQASKPRDLTRALPGMRLLHVLLRFGLAEQVTAQRTGQEAMDAPLDARNLERLAPRAILGLGRTGSPMTDGSGGLPASPR